MIIKGVVLIPGLDLEGNYITPEAIQKAFEHGIKTPPGTKALILEEDTNGIPKGSLVLVK